jgi:uncharacterized protein YkwD
MFRTIAVLASALVVLAAPVSSSARPNGAVGPAANLQAALVAQVNVLRASHGLSRLQVSPALNAAAAGHSTQMARLGYFSHNSANGQSFARRVASYYTPRGYRTWSVGENLVYGSPDLGAAQALRLWLASPPHRANLMNPRWRELGLSAVHATSAPGVYHGAPATIVTADFGARSR